MRPTPIRILLALALATLATGAAHAATYHGRNVDGRWYEGRAVSTTYGAYHVQLRFNGDRVYIRIVGSNQQLVGFLEDEVILDPHEVVAHDPPRGVDWTIDVFDLTS